MVKYIYLIMLSLSRHIERVNTNAAAVEESTRPSSSPSHPVELGWTDID